MPPPDLTRDAPVLNVPHPSEVIVRPLFGDQADLSGLDGLDRRLGERPDLHEPLRGQVGLHRSKEHTSELQSQSNLVCRLLLEKKKKNHTTLLSRNQADANTLQKHLLQL